MSLAITLAEIWRRTAAFRKNANDILAQHESSASRIISVEATFKRLTQLSLQQEELFRQALRCIEHGIFRAAHVMGWAAFIDYLEQKLASDGLARVRTMRPAWNKYTSIEELREYIPEHQIIEVARDVGLFGKNETKTVLGLLSKRNECAHPSSASPGLNESLGYITELFRRIKTLQPKKI